MEKFTFLNMEHAKKMMLIDANFDLGNIKRRHTLLDQSISKVLYRQDLDDQEKIKLYQQTLKKYLVNRKRIKLAVEGQSIG